MPEQKRKGVQGAWSLVKTVISWLSAALAIGLMIFAVLSSCFLGGDGASLLGYRFFSVKSDSMAATDFATGDVIITKEVEPSTLKEGDIITFVSQNWGSFGETMTHKIRRHVVDSSGNPGFITYGTTTDSDDETVVTYEYIIGQYQGRIPKIGTLFEFIKTAPGMLLCLFIPFVLVLFIHGSNLVRSMTLWQKERLRVSRAKERGLHGNAGGAYGAGGADGEAGRVSKYARADGSGRADSFEPLAGDRHHGSGQAGQDRGGRGVRPIGCNCYRGGAPGADPGSHDGSVKG